MADRMTCVVDVPAVDDLDVVKREVVVKSGGVTLVSSDLDGRDAGSVGPFDADQDSFVDLTITTVDDGGGRTPADFTLQVLDTNAPAPSGAPSIRVISETEDGVPSPPPTP